MSTELVAAAGDNLEMYDDLLESAHDMDKQFADLNLEDVNFRDDDDINQQKIEQSW